MPGAGTAIALRGQTLAFRADPFKAGPEGAVDFNPDGAVAIKGGKIARVGPAREVLADFPGIAVETYRDDLIMAGFVDSHVHFPQTEIIAAYGAQLLEWLERYTLPAERKFADPTYARAAAEFFLDECLRNGVTAASVYGTVHPQSVDAFFEAASRRNMRVAAGKVLMDRNAPDGLADTAERGYRESKTLLERWHGRGRNSYVITPRFAAMSTPAQLEAAATLWKEHPTALMQTHMSENRREIEWVQALYPEAPDYLGVYERYGLLGPGSNFGHAIHLSPREVALLRESRSGVSHCPTSNLFMGSGLFDLGGLRDAEPPVAVGLATDVGAGSSFSMFATMRAAYEIGQLRGYSLHPAKAFYLATAGSAAVMRMDGAIGNLAPGFDADLIVVDLRSRPLIAERMRHAADLFEVLFVQMILADDRAIRATYVGGRKLYDRDAPAGRHARGTLAGSANLSGGSLPK